jgi:integrase
MAKLNLTKAQIESLPIPATGAMSYQDTQVRGLYLRVSASGVRTWNVFKWSRALRRPMRLSLGPYPSVSTDQARRRATEVVVALDQGRDPSAEKKARFAVPTLGELSRSYAGRLQATKHRHSGYLHSLVLLSFEDWLARRVNTLTQREISERHDLIAERRGPVAAARAVKALRTLFNYADRDLGISLKNVARSIRVRDSRPRGRYMSRDEEFKLLTVLQAESQDVQDFVRLLMLTGARRDNVAAMRWVDVDWREAVWRIPNEMAKAGEAIEVPLVPEAHEIVQRRKDVHEATGFCFPSRGKKGRLVEVWYMWRRLRARAILLDLGLDWRLPKPMAAVQNVPESKSREMGLRDLTIHDLRRTLAVRMVSAGASLPVVAAALGHRNLKTTQQVYALATQSDVRAALERAIA